MKRRMIKGFLLGVLALAVFVPAFSAFAQDVAEKTVVTQGPLQKISNYFSTQEFTYSDGTSITRDIIGGPPKPPAGYESERAAVALPKPDPAAATNTLTVPAYEWVFGCSAVSGSMIAAYYDRNGFPNIYTGPTGGGVMPLTEVGTTWGTWSDGSTTYPNNPLIASHNGLEGRTSRGSIDDYWIQYQSTANDPYVGHWSQHTWGTAIGDYMKTSQSAYDNTDGSTTFWSYNSASLLTCEAMESLSAGGTFHISDVDGTYGRKLFYEARGYTVTDCYNQKTDNKYSGGFSFAQFKAEIDAGRPVFLNLAGHSIVGVGYDDSGNTVYVHDTWDHSNHTMTWGGSYSGMELLTVSMVKIEESTCSYTITSANPINFKYNGGSATVKILANDATCPAPSVVSNDEWLTYSNLVFKKGKGTVRIKAAANTSSLDRTPGTVDIQDQTLTVNQTGKPCTFGAFVPPRASFGSDAHTGNTFTVTTKPADCGWTATVDAAATTWITITGQGSGTVTYNVAAGAGKARAGKINVNFTQTGRTNVKKPFSINQSKRPG